MKSHHLLTGVILFLFPLISFSQIVNIESARMQSDTLGWMGNAGASFSLIQTTEKIFSANADIHLQYKSPKNLYLIFGSYGYLSATSRKYINNRFFHLRFNHKMGPVLRWEVFTQIQNNLITKIKERFLLGTGPRFKILAIPFIKIYAATLVMYEYEEELTTPVVTHSVARSSSYVSFTMMPSKQVEIISTTFYQPRFSNFSDYRILNEAVLKIKTSKNWSFKMVWNYLFDKFPPDSTPKTNYILSAGFNFEF
jgi:hypothetical protein